MNLLRDFTLAYHKRLITIAKCRAATSSSTMLAAERYPDVFADVTQPKHELLEIYRSKISVHHAKAGYSYPTIRLLHTFSKLAGLHTRIYQTVHDGALTFLVVIPRGMSVKHNAERSENVEINAKSPVLT